MVSQELVFRSIDAALRLLDILKWPVVILLLFSLIKPQLPELIQALRRVRLPGGAELEFETQVRELEEEAEHAAAAVERPEERAQRGTIQALVQNLGLDWAPRDTDLSYHMDLAEEDPNLSLAGLRMDIEGMLRNIAGREADWEPDRPASATRLVSVLASQDLIPQRMARLLKELISVCNSAVHAQDVSEETAIRVIDSARPFWDFYLDWLMEQAEEG